MTRRTTRQLTDREAAILAAVGDHRVLTGAQVQRWFFPVSPGGSAAGALRRTQRCCHRLVEERVLDTLDRRVGGVRSGSSGFCYVLGTEGQRLVQPERRARRTGTLGAAYVDHALATAELHVRLIEAHRAAQIDEFELETEPECWRSFLGAAAQPVAVKPDLFVSIRSSDLERRWFVEVDRGTASLVRVANKCRLYLAYLRSGEEQRRHSVFPKVLWTVPTARRLQQLTDVVSGLPPPADRLFAVSLHDNAIDHLKGGVT